MDRSNSAHTNYGLGHNECSSHSLLTNSYQLYKFAQKHENQGLMDSREHPAVRICRVCLPGAAAFDEGLDAVDVNIVLADSRAEDMIESEPPILS